MSPLYDQTEPPSSPSSTPKFRENKFFNPVKLTEYELWWSARYSFFLKNGYMLRPRYKPDWKPSWVGTNLDPIDCEDSIRPFMPTLLDARSRETNRPVCIKRITKKSKEVEIARYLSPRNLPDAHNHCVEILASFQDPEKPGTSYIVMPLLRQFDDPEFGSLGEVVDFVTQILEGTAFIHRNLVAHGDLTGANIMMDASSILPRGWHFVSPSFTPDGQNILAPLARIDYPVKYFIIDHDCSVRFSPGQSPIIDGLGGRDNDAPELFQRKPFDHFKLDVFTLGNVFLKDFSQKYLGLEFLESLTDFMMTRDPHMRPTANEALQYWYNIRDNLNTATARWRLRKPDESVGERVIKTVAAARDNLRYLFHGDERKSWSSS
ncbi:kinase-like domain-containing protein [Collybia nuda]|uniref:Kinase-like domain-containing protein n=1 Tax=Collybia nuda TaxID=64659 RepID=A0A9P6CGU8_9AGAR|nr:kinase-like domain-containing protein [Collybia nuda]